MRTRQSRQIRVEVNPGPGAQQRLLPDACVESAYTPPYKAVPRKLSSLCQRRGSAHSHTHPLTAATQTSRMKIRQRNNQPSQQFRTMYAVSTAARVFRVRTEATRREAGGRANSCARSAARKALDSMKLYNSCLVNKGNKCFIMLPMHPVRSRLVLHELSRVRTP